MIIKFVNQKNKNDTIKVNREELLVPYNKNTLKTHWGIRVKKRINDASPITIGYFESEDKRDAVLEELKNAVNNNEREYTLEGALPVNRDFDIYNNC